MALVLLRTTSILLLLGCYCMAAVTASTDGEVKVPTDEAATTAVDAPPQKTIYEQIPKESAADNPVEDASEGKKVSSAQTTAQDVQGVQNESEQTTENKQKPASKQDSVDTDRGLKEIRQKAETGRQPETQGESPKKPEILLGWQQTLVEPRPDRTLGQPMKISQMIHYIRQRNGNGKLEGPLRVIATSKRKFKRTIGNSENLQQLSTTEKTEAGKNNSKHNINTFSENVRNISFDTFETIKNSTRITPKIIRLNDTPVMFVDSLETLYLINISQRIESMQQNHRTKLPKVLYQNNSRAERHYLQSSSSKASYMIQKRSKICIFEGNTYKVGDRVPTAEPCLECICYERTIICGLRVCPKAGMLEARLDKCKVTHKKGKCCPDIVCDTMDGESSRNSGTEITEVSKGNDFKTASNGSFSTNQGLLSDTLNILSRNLSTHANEWQINQDKMLTKESRADDRILQVQFENSTDESLNVNQVSSSASSSVNASDNYEDKININYNSGYKRSKNKIRGSFVETDFSINDGSNVRRIADINAVVPVNSPNGSVVFSINDSLNDRNDNINVISSSTNKMKNNHFKKGKDCVIEGVFFAEGSAIPGTDQCTYCFCIRGLSSCVAHHCVLPMKGCRPRYRAFTCCPSYYDCHDARPSAVGQPEGKMLSRYPLTPRVTRNAVFTTVVTEHSITFPTTLSETATTETATTDAATVETAQVETATTDEAIIEKIAMPTSNQYEDAEIEIKVDMSCTVNGIVYQEGVEVTEKQQTAEITLINDSNHYSNNKTHKNRTTKSDYSTSLDRNKSNFSKNSKSTTVRDACRVCFCFGGKVQCQTHDCDVSPEGCTPIYEERRCCPIHFTCEEATDSKKAARLLEASPEPLQPASSISEQHVVALEELSEPAYEELFDNREVSTPVETKNDINEDLNEEPHGSYAPEDDSVRSEFDGEEVEGENYPDEVEDSSDPKVRGGPSSRRTLSTLMRKRAQQQNARNREKAAERAQSYYERHGVQVLTQQEDELKPGTRRYKLRNKPPPSSIAERRRKQEERQHQQRRQQEEKQLEKQHNEDPNAAKDDQIPKISILNRRQQLSQKRKQQEQQKQPAQQVDLPKDEIQNEEPTELHEQKQASNKQTVEQEQDSNMQVVEPQETNSNKQIVEPQETNSNKQVVKQQETNSNKQVVEQQEANSNKQVVEPQGQVDIEIVGPSDEPHPQQTEKNSSKSSFRDLLEARRRNHELKQQLQQQAHIEQQLAEDKEQNKDGQLTIIEQVLSLRNMGNPTSTFVDLPSHELHSTTEETIKTTKEEDNKKIQIEEKLNDEAKNSPVVSRGQQDTEQDILEQKMFPGDSVLQIESQNDNQSIASELELQKNTSKESKTQSEIIKISTGINAANASYDEAGLNVDANVESEDPDKISPEHSRPNFKRPFFRRTTVPPVSESFQKEYKPTPAREAGTTRGSVPSFSRPSLFRRKNTKEPTGAAPTEATTPVASPEHSELNRAKPTGITSHLRKRPSLFRDRTEESANLDSSIKHETSEDNNENHQVSSRANSKYRNPQEPVNSPSIHIKPSTEPIEEDENQTKNITLTEDTQDSYETSHLQYIEDDPNEIFKFEDTIIEEVTVKYTQEPQTYTTSDTTQSETLPETDDVNENLQSTEPVNVDDVTTSMTTLKDDITGHSDSLLTTVGAAESFTQMQDHVTNDEETGVTDDVSTAAETKTEDAKQSDDTTEYDTEKYTTTLTPTPENTQTIAATTRSSVNFNARPFRYSLYNRRPDSKLQEIIERRTAGTSTTTEAILETLSDDETKIPTQVNTIGIDALTEKYEDITAYQMSTPLINAEYETDEKVNSNFSEIPIVASTVVTVTTNPVKYMELSVPIKESLNNETPRLNDVAPLNIADEYNKLNLISEPAHRDDEINTFTQISDYAILNELKSVISESTKLQPIYSSAIIEENHPHEDFTGAMDEDVNTTIIPFGYGTDYNNDYTANATVLHNDYYEYYENYDVETPLKNDTALTAEDYLEDYNAYDTTPQDTLTHNNSTDYDLTEYKTNEDRPHVDDYSLNYDVPFDDYALINTETKVESNYDSFDVQDNVDNRDMTVEAKLPQGVAILTDGFYYPAKSTLAPSTQPVPESPDLQARDDIKVATGFYVKDIPRKTEIKYGATDIEGNKVRTDRKNTINSQENSQVQEMIIEDENSDGPVKLLVGSSVERISAGDQDTFDISVSSSLFAGAPESRRPSGIGQVLNADTESGNVVNENGNKEVDFVQKNENENTVTDDIKNIQNHNGNEEDLVVGVGKVIPVNVEIPEYEQNFQGTLVPPPPPPAPTAAPSFLGALFDIFTRTERPRARPKPRPPRPNRIRPSPPRNANGTDISPEDKADFSLAFARPRPGSTLFRPQRPNHPYRPFSPTGFRPRPNFPQLRPPPPISDDDLANIDQTNLGEISADETRIPESFKPGSEFDERPLFKPDPDNASRPQLVDKPLSPSSNLEMLEEPIQITSFELLPVPSIMSQHDLEQENETREITTVPPEIFLELTNNAKVDTIENVDHVSNDEPITDDPESFVPGIFTTKTTSNITPVIEIKGPMEFFVNQLGDPDDIKVHSNKSDSDLALPITSAVTFTDEPVKPTEPSDSADNIKNKIENYAITKVSTQDKNDAESEFKNGHEPHLVDEHQSFVNENISHISEAENENFQVSTGKINLSIDDDSSDKVVLQHDVGEKFQDQSQQGLISPETTSNYHIITTKEPSLHSLESSAQEDTANILTTNLTPTKSATETTSTTQKSTVATSSFDSTSTSPSALESETEGHESYVELELPQPEAELPVIETAEEDSLGEYDYFGSDKLSTSEHEIAQPTASSEVIMKDVIDDSQYLDDNIQIETLHIAEIDVKGTPTTDLKTTPHPYHDIPDGSFVSSSRVESDRPLTDTVLPRPRPTVVLPGSRPSLPFPNRPPFERPVVDIPNEASKQHLDKTPRPFIETMLPSHRHEEQPPKEDSYVEEDKIKSSKQPTLPPSLPNLQIIPFVAADAVKKAEDSLAQEYSQDSPNDGILPDFLPGAPIPGQHELCWQDGRLLGNGVPVNYTKDPCQSCRCYFGQLICQQQQCQEVPQHCEGVLQPDQCCPMIVCEHKVKLGEPIPHDFRGDVALPYDSLDYVEKPSDKVEETNEAANYGSEVDEYLHDRKDYIDGNEDEYAYDDEEKMQAPAKMAEVTTSSYPIHPASLRPSISTVPPSAQSEEKSNSAADIDRRRPLIPNRLASLDRKPPARDSPFMDRLEVPPMRPKPTINGTRATLPFIFRKRPGDRPTLNPPRKASFLQSSSTTESTSTTTEQSVSAPMVSTTVKIRHPTTNADDIKHQSTTTARPFLEDFVSFLDKGSGESSPNFLLPRPIQQTTDMESSEIENLLLQDRFRFSQNQRTTIKPIKMPAKPILPDIPEEVKSQLPLGIDAIMASGMFQLSGCNIYGREYKVGESITELSSPCKACRCTPVGVQCLPIC